MLTEKVYEIRITNPKNKANIRTNIQKIPLENDCIAFFLLMAKHLKLITYVR